MKKSLLLIFMALLCFKLNAQITTSTLSGLVSDNGGGVPGATVVAIHTPTGTKYTTQTRGDGRYTLPNINVGGPYSVTVTFLGFQPQTKSGITASLGDDMKVNFLLSSDTKQLDEVVVKGTQRANSPFDKNSLNTTTVFDAEKLAATPTMNRNLNDFVRQTPQARADYQGGISIAGQNNKYNSVSINGAPANDQFGLAATGTNGGQANSSPIPVDAIEQLQVNVSPFDIRYSGFLGGSINAVTKSGTNKVVGGFSYFLRNQGLAGKTPTDNPSAERIKLPDFSAKTYSVNLGGPLVKDKLFLFVAGEYQKSETPRVFDASSYRGGADQSAIDALANTLRTKYNYEPGGYANNTAIIDRKAITAKLDWNISNKHKFSLFYNHINAENVSTRASSATAINFNNGAIVYPNKTHQFTAELKSSFSNRLSNSLLVGFTDVLDDRGGLGSPFPSVQIRDGAGSIYFGTEAFSAANQLKQKTYSLINETKLYAGKHTVSLIEDFEYNDYYNLFIRQAYGAYVYDSLTDFNNDTGPASYNYSYSLVDNIAGDGSAAAAKFKTYRAGLALQDKWDVTDKTTILLGLRGDLIGYADQPVVDNYFNNNALGPISRYYNLSGARSGQSPDAYISLSPRFAIKHSLENGKTQFRGGLGIFQSRVTAVTPGGMFSNAGVLIGGYTNNSNPRLPGGGLPFQADVSKQYRAEAFGATTTSPSGEMNIMAKDYRAPKVAKFNFAVDQKLPGGITGTIEGNYTLNLNQTMYYNVNILPSSRNAIGADGRPLYSTTKVDLNPSLAGVQNPYTYVMLVKNGGRAGRSYVVSGSLAKKFQSGFDVSGSYVFSRAQVMNEPTSSQNSSQWRYMETVYGKNNLTLTNSDFDFGHMAKANISYSKDWFKFGGTSIGLFYTGQSGTRYTYVYRNSILGDDGTSSSNDVIYVPRSASELNFTSLTVGSGASAVTYTPAQQREAFDRFIDNDPYLSKMRGKYSERNGARLPFVNMLDLHVEQNFFIKVGNSKQRLAVSFDINNLGNLINKDWGRFYFLSNDNYQLLTVTGVNATTGVPSYQFNPTVTSAKDNAYSIQDFSNFNSSRWTGQLGLKYFFN